MLDDHPRPAQPEVVDSVVAAGVCTHLALALRAKGDRPLQHSGRSHSAGHRKHRIRVAPDCARTKTPGGQLDHERRVARKGVVLPSGGGAGRKRNGLVRQARAARIQPLEGAISSPAIDQPQHLVVVERDPRLDSPDQTGGHAGLGFRKRPGSRVVGVEGLADGAPAEGEVAVEIDAAGILPCARRGAIGVEVVDQPQLHAPRRARPPQPPGHGAPGRLGAVDLSHHQHPNGRARVADAHCADRAPPHRVPDRLEAPGRGLRLLSRAGGGGRRHGRRDGGHEGQPPAHAGAARAGLGVKVGRPGASLDTRGRSLGSDPSTSSTSIVP